MATPSVVYNLGNNTEINHCYQESNGLPRRVSKYLPTNAGDPGDMGSIPGLRISPGGGNGNPLQYSCLENPMDWWTIVHRVKKSQTTDHTCAHAHIHTHTHTHTHQKSNTPHPPPKWVEISNPPSQFLVYDYIGLFNPSAC